MPICRQAPSPSRRWRSGCAAPGRRPGGRRRGPRPAPRCGPRRAPGGGDVHRSVGLPCRGVRAGPRGGRQGKLWGFRGSGNPSPAARLDTPAQVAYALRTFVPPGGPGMKPAHQPAARPAVRHPGPVPRARSRRSTRPCSASSRPARSSSARRSPPSRRKRPRTAGRAYGVGCGSGTDALLLALHALGVGPGDEVIVPPFTFFATAGSVCRIGATPVFADIDPVTYNLDPTQVEGKITRADAGHHAGPPVRPVRGHGRRSGASPRDNGLVVVEDAAQSFGSRVPAASACGTLGAVGCFSFYPTKNLGGLGDAGLVTTNDPDWAKKLQALRVHGVRGEVLPQVHRLEHPARRGPRRHPAGEAAAPGRLARRPARRPPGGTTTLIEEAGLDGFFQRPVSRRTAGTRSTSTSSACRRCTATRW